MNILKSESEKSECSVLEQNCSDFKEAAELFKAISDETRLGILKNLRQHNEICACDFTGCCGLSQPTVSYHLKVLREAGLVDMEKRGSWVYYSLNHVKMDALRDMLP